MMELLAGPNFVASVNGVHTAPVNINRAFWDDELGIGSLASYATGSDSFGFGANYFIAQLDGVCGARAKAQPGGIVLDMSGQYEWLLYYTERDSLGTVVGNLFAFDKQSGVYANNLVVSNPGIFSSAFIYPQIRTADRLIRIQGPVVDSTAIDGSEPNWTTECTLVDGSVGILSSLPSVSRTKNPAVVCLIYPSGDILFYDVIAKQQVLNGWFARIGTNNGGWYSVKFDIYISYTISGTDWYVSVWANAVRPATLSNPEPMTSVASAHTTQFRVRLLGAHNEPCEGELISWSITDGAGSLTAPQSKTDANGYAYIGYVAPINSGSTATIQAVAEF